MDSTLRKPQGALELGLLQVRGQHQGEKAARLCSQQSREVPPSCCSSAQAAPGHPRRAGSGCPGQPLLAAMTTRSQLQEQESLLC